jgi:hypothetical protein
VGDVTYSLEESLCAVIFNAMGYLHELMKKQTGFQPNEEANNWD